VAVEPPVEAAVVHVLVHQELGLRAGQAAEELHDVVVPDVAEHVHLRLELPLQVLLHLPARPYALHGHHGAGARAAATTAGALHAVHAPGPALADQVLVGEPAQDGRLTEIQRLESGQLPRLLGRGEPLTPLDVADDEEGERSDNGEQHGAGGEKAGAKAW